MNVKSYAKMNYTLCLVSAAADGARQGCIVNSFHQATSARPAKFTVTLNRDSETCKAVAAAGSFAVTLLAKDCPDALITLFGYKSGRVGDKFAAYAPETDQAGNPYLKEHMVSRVSCRVTDSMQIGNFMLYVGEAVEAEMLAGGDVLTLDDLAQRGRSAPPTATVYREVQINGYRCTVCGYVHEAEALPPDFRCPLCNAPASKFEMIRK